MSSRGIHFIALESQASHWLNFCLIHIRILKIYCHDYLMKGGRNKIQINQEKYRVFLIVMKVSLLQINVFNMA